MTSSTIGTGTARRADRGGGIGRQLRMLRAMTRTEWRLLLREPSAFFFTLIFPLLLVLVFGAVFGNDPDDGYDGRGAMDVQIPAYMTLIVGTLSIFNIPIQLASYRELGVFRRLRVTPIQPWVIFAAQLLVGFIVTAIGTALMLLLGRLLFDLAMPARPFATVTVLVLAVISFGSAGFLIGALCSTARQASLVANVLYFPQLFLSGASFPRQLFPDWLRSVSEWLPLSQLVIQIQALWVGDGWRVTTLIYLAVLFVVGIGLSSRLFRWER